MKVWVLSLYNPKVFFTLGKADEYMESIGYTMSGESSNFGSVMFEKDDYGYSTLYLKLVEVDSWE